MINADMKEYQYYLYADDNGYGQPTLSDDPAGSVKMAIYTTSQAIQDNIQYKGATYLGLTNDTKINDKCVIGYGSEKLKVLYINPQGRYKQVFMGTM
jgi:hypothetical protein